MRENLVGYLLGALEEDEKDELEAALFRVDHRRSTTFDPADLRRELDLLRLALRPLEHDADAITPPMGLASRTIDFVEANSRRRSRAALSPAADVVPMRPAGRVWLDRAIIAATALAASVLLAPLLLDTIEQARSRRAERNLGVISEALHGYASHHRVFPSPPDSGPLSRAGLYAPMLVSEERLVADDGTVVLPGSPLAKGGRFKVPTLQELEAAVGSKDFEEMVRSMGGDFGYTLGHRSPEGTLEAVPDRRRAEHAIMADAPDEMGRASRNHPGGLHHVLFEDGHVMRMFLEDIGGQDHIYRNHNGVIAAGVCEDDAVIGASHHAP